MRFIAGKIFPGDVQPQADQQCATHATVERWLVHVLIGDGIGTNEAAAKRLWACFQSQRLGRHVRYFLLLLRCGTHQVGLAAKNAVVGRAAKVAGGALNDELVGCAVRLFKYVICDYFDDLCRSVHEWVLRDLRVLPQSEADAAAHARTVGLRSLYTAHVLPDELMSLWNNGLHSMTHVVPAGHDPEAERPTLVARFAKFIIDNLLHVDSAPTLTRFFTFRGCTDRMTTMEMIGMVADTIKVKSVIPRKENQKRIKRIHAFFKHEDAQQTLRRASLNFQLTGGVEAMLAILTSSSQAESRRWLAIFITRSTRLEPKWLRLEPQWLRNVYVFV